MTENLKFKRGFTLLELIVAMAIIAVLIGLSILGIQTVQRASRDTERRTYLETLNLEITDYYANNGTYPALTVSGQNVTVGSGGKVVTLKGAAQIDTALTATPYAGPSGTRYCYQVTGASYRLGVALEGGSWFNLGTSSTLCSAPVGTGF